MGGLWTTVPLMAGLGLFFALASLGLPGLGNFVGEFLVLLGAYGLHPVIVIPAVLGLVLAAVYSLWMMFQTFLGPQKETWAIPDLSSRELVTLAVMALTLVWLGFYPNPVIRTAAPSVDYAQGVIKRAPIKQLGLVHLFSNTVPLSRTCVADQSVGVGVPSGPLMDQHGGWSPQMMTNEIRDRICAVVHLVYPGRLHPVYEATGSGKP
jgi:NADH:ubiquinone oxidoreductase subunit 5 (subunit L)/multisubunit Na+/H+ antiporter MnhA subunit